MDFWPIDLLANALPPWLLPVIITVDLLIRVVVIGWVPYRRKPSVGLGWLMAIFLLPYVGIIAFLIFGSSKLPAKRRDRQRTINEFIKEQAGERPIMADTDGLAEPLVTSAQLNYSLGALPLVDGNEFTLLPDNNEALQEMARAIDKAEEYVHFEFYIAGLDDTTRPLFDALVRAADRGVGVRVLIDHIGSLGYPGYAELVSILNRSKIEWRRSLPVRPWKNEYQRPDLRNHRKILVIDRKLAYTGSLNAIDRTYNKRRNLRKGFQWKDLAVRATGPIVTELDAVFASDWYSETNEIIAREINFQMAGDANSGILAQAVPSGPGFPLENNLRLFNHLIYNANERIVICSPYFVPNESLLQALTTEAHSGVDIRIYLSEKSDHSITQYAQESYYAELMEAGVKIYRYPAPTVLHSKFLMIDDNVTIIGSSNMDERSFSMNLEVSLFIIDEEFAQSMYELEEADYMATATCLDPAEWDKRPLWHRYRENVCRLTSSLL